MIIVDNTRTNEQEKLRTPEKFIGSTQRFQVFIFDSHSEESLASSVPTVFCVPTWFPVLVVTASDPTPTQRDQSLASQPTKKDYDCLWSLEDLDLIRKVKSGRQYSLPFRAVLYLLRPQSIQLHTTAILLVSLSRDYNCLYCIEDLVDLIRKVKSRRQYSLPAIRVVGLDSLRL